MKSFSSIPLLLVLNLAVYLLWQMPGKELFMESHFLISWTDLASGHFFNLLGAAFSHNALWHFLLNMLVLRSFGPVLEATLGRRAFLIFYLAAGIFSSFSHAFISNFILHEPEMPALGASGAISGLVLLFALQFPKQKLLLFGFIPMPAIWGAVLFVGLDIWGLWAQSSGGGLPIGHGAHLGGALAGLIFYLYNYLTSRSRRTSAPSSSISTNRFSDS